ncbi:helix-turn-helix domain-containing protein [Pukyongiella litopenaei]|uniref:Helix-turn-helix transcriptional regulator n=1 Tax=Pukyongiella litopenaei TaxID=2605946 RepID=A0A2S0MTP7_9RHOB|nr:helix-turn-helix transcriptional regulator [Pukyongiella litopenaei]AVO39101.1 helix-turn-helix transcriptional regulator [Pukyongiella litopenaei]
MFGRNLRRLARDYPSISELARRLDVNRTQFNRYLSGESFPRPDVLDRICRFFDIDARVLLEPVETIVDRGRVLRGPVLAGFAGAALAGVTEDRLPGGFYRYSRNSYVSMRNCITGIVTVFRRGGDTYLRGYEPRDAVRQQGLRLTSDTREFRGYVCRDDDGVYMVISRRRGRTPQFYYLAPVTSLAHNFWLGYAARTARETSTDRRVTRLVFEHLGKSLATDRERIMTAARSSGLSRNIDLPTFHRRLLQADHPFQ